MVAKIFFMVLYALVAIFCFYVQTQGFNILFLLVGLLCLGLIGWNIKKMIAKPEDEEEMEADEQW
ncbi:hypothetical protein QO009_004187 [Brevibacillus aydinogluensis]|jgi:hypothetical protein|uniref:hypothetical protein n=1 Tax=Brevibacillus aydinogluensis TaxID=927786 RepID=UPI002892FE26|nr:hypothetical protein [Brevibacillus aydinogluensis]MDT3418253.1 hypothetical protein [Brevibacillus aydinogluensis]